jgi:hypothetical protein
MRHGAYQSKQRKIGMRIRPNLHGLDITTLQGSNEKHDQSGERSCSDQNIAFIRLTLNVSGIIQGDWGKAEPGWLAQPL